jgi:hypothetical protein
MGSGLVFDAYTVGQGAFPVPDWLRSSEMRFVRRHISGCFTLAICARVSYRSQVYTKHTFGEVDCDHAAILPVPTSKAV